jgi:hypothetical protein
MVQITNTHWAVEVPEGAKELHIEVSLKGSPYIGYKFKDDELLNEYQNIYLPPGTWEIVCTSKGATYMQATTIVEHLRGGFVNYDGNSVPQTGGYDTPFKSLNSLLTSKGCDLNKNWLILKKTV